jgi:TolB protein
MNVDGSDQTRVTNDADRDGDPAWTGDGRIVFVKFSSPFAGDLWIVNADGSGLRQLTSGGTDTQPTSSARNQIAFSRQTNGASSASIFAMSTRGTGLSQVTTDALAYDEHPDFAPDSQRIVFDRFTQADEANHLWIQRRNGSGLQRLTFTPNEVDAQAQWSPNGRRIVFTSCPLIDPTTCGPHDIHALNANGTGLVQLTFDGSSHSPAFQPLPG